MLPFHFMKMGVLELPFVSLSVSPSVFVSRLHGPSEPRWFVGDPTSLARDNTVPVTLWVPTFKMIIVIIYKLGAIKLPHTLVLFFE